MQVKKSHLIIFCIVAVILIISGLIGYDVYEKKAEKERATQELKEDFEREVERQYKSLKYDYESYCKTLSDYDYSSSLRRRYIGKINDLLGERRYEDVWDFNSSNSYKKSGDLDLLRQQATQKAYSRFMGLDDWTPVPTFLPYFVIKMRGNLNRILVEVATFDSGKPRWAIGFRLCLSTLKSELTTQQIGVSLTHRNISKKKKRTQRLL